MRRASRGRTHLSMSCLREAMAERGRPLAMPFAMMSTSGTASSPLCSARYILPLLLAALSHHLSMANMVPVRPYPLCTSSTISRMPCCRVSSRTRRR